MKRVLFTILLTFATVFLTSCIEEQTTFKANNLQEYLNHRYDDEIEILEKISLEDWQEPNYDKNYYVYFNCFSSKLQKEFLIR